MNITASEMGKYLELLGKTGTIVCYSDVELHFKIPKTYDWKNNPLYPIYGQIDREDIAARRPLRTSIIVKKDGEKKTVPSTGYFTRLCHYRGIPIAKTAKDMRKVHASELEALRKYYDSQPREE